MGPHVFGQAPSLTERLETSLALVRSFATVRATMLV